MLYNINFEASAIAYLIVLNLYIRIQYTAESPSNKYFRRLAATMLLAVVLDVVTAVTISYYQAVPLWLNIALNEIYFLLDILLEYYFVIYCICTTRGKIDKPYIIQTAHSIMTFCVLFMLSNVFTGWIFYFDENGYQHGPIYLIVHIIPIAVIIITSVIMLFNFRKFNNKQRISIVLYIIVLVSGPVVQLMFPNVLFVLFTISVGLMLLMFGMETPDYQALTQTMNELRKTRDEAEEAMAAAQSASQAKTFFLSSISHEIRTPINAILGYNEMMLRDAEKKETVQYCVNIQSAGKTLLSMISDMMDYTEIETGSINLEKSDYSTVSMITDVTIFGRYFADKKDIELRVKADPTMPKELHGDSARITRIFCNLLSNAVKYTNFGHVDVTIRWELESISEGYLYAEVTDTGIGIHGEDLANITSAFQRVDKKRNQNIQGLGLGLTIVTKLLAMMDGALDIRSEYGKGTTVSFRIKQEIVDSTPLGEMDLVAHKPEKIAMRPGFTAPDARLLAVDDNIMNLELYRGILKETRIQIDTAVNGVEALEYISRYKYDLIILDHMMPLMDGMETLKTIKKQNLCSDVPILVITANAVSGEKSAYLNAGFDDYLSKPVSSRQLLEAVRKYLPENLIQPDILNYSYTEDDISESGAVERLSEFLDVKSAMNYCCNSEELYLSVVKTYVEENRLDAIRKFFDEKDFDNYRIQVHALKSGSRIVGAGELEERARLLEMAAKSGDIEYIAENNDALLDEYKSLLERIEAAVDFAENKIENCGLTVLYVDDDLMYRSLVKRMLRDGFGSVLTNQSAEEALETLNSKIAEAQENGAEPDLPQIILLDLNLSGMNGLSLLRKLRESDVFGKIPAVIYTSDDDRETQLECLRAGAADFIAKPADWEVLTERLKRLAVMSE